MNISSNIDSASNDYRAGFAAVIGAPNAGKSTLVNQLVGDKVSIVSEKAQTTRSRIKGIFTQNNTQVVLIDTPGIFNPKERLGKAMVKAAWQSIEDADVIIVIVDASGSYPDPRVESIISGLKRSKRKAVLALNKIDKIKREQLLPLADELNKSEVFEKTFMISALTGDGVGDLKNYVIEKMPKSPWLFPPDQLSDLPERLWAAEITREQIFRQLHQELPYSAVVFPDKWEERKDGSVAIYQTIVVLRPNHRAIVLGKNGSRIKSIGKAAREEMALRLGRKVHLFLEVKVDEKWQERPDFYRTFGLDA